MEDRFVHLIKLLYNVKQTHSIPYCRAEAREQWLLYFQDKWMQATVESLELTVQLA